tara:strand:- start:508 stop:984 length:477 start_codon:yes stop_codon:yes gene_type:complete
METTYLFPNKYQKIGWAILIPSAIMGILTVANDWNPAILDVEVFAILIEGFSNHFRVMGMVANNILDEICGILLIIGCILVAFSKETDEDELISSIRLKSLVWATYWNYGILLLAFLLVYDISFFWVMIFNLYTILIFFIFKFKWSVRQLRKGVLDEE